PIEKRRSSCNSRTTAPVRPATRTVAAVLSARRALPRSWAELATASASIAMTGTRTSSVSLPRIRSLPSSTRRLPPADRRQPTLVWRPRREVDDAGVGVLRRVAGPVWRPTAGRPPAADAEGDRGQRQEHTEAARGEGDVAVEQDGVVVRRVD